MGKIFFEVLIDKKVKKDPLVCKYCNQKFKKLRQRVGHQSRCVKNPKYHYWASYKK